MRSSGIFRLFCCVWRHHCAARRSILAKTATCICISQTVFATSLLFYLIPDFNFVFTAKYDSMFSTHSAICFVRLMNF